MTRTTRATRTFAIALLAWVATATPTMADDSALTAAQSTCWICNLINQFLALIQHVVLEGTPAVANTMWPILTVLCGIGFLYRIAKGMIGGTPFFEDIGGMFLRLSVAGLIVAGPVNAGRLVADYFIGLPMQIAPTIGNSIAETAAQTYNLTYNPNQCIHKTTAETGVDDATFVSVSDAIMPLACRIHYAMATAMRVGAVISTHERDEASSTSMAQTAVLAASGLMVMYVSFMALMAFGLALGESLLTLGIFGAFMPFYAFFTIFPSTRDLTKNAVGTLAYNFFLLVFTGACASVVVFISLIGMTLGLGGSVASLMTPDQIATGAQSTLLTQGTASGFAATIKFAAYTGIATFISTRLLRGISDLATQISQMGQTAVPTRIFAGSVASTVTSVSTISFGALAYAGSMIGKTGATALGKAAGRVAGRRAGTPRTPRRP